MPMIHEGIEAIDNQPMPNNINDHNIIINEF